MVCLALVLELHHPLPGPEDGVGAGWAASAIDCDWPVLRAVSRFAANRSGGALTLAVSPSWMALASDGSARTRLLGELDGRGAGTAGESSLRQFLVDRWDGDAIALIRELAGSAAVDVIPTTSTHTWLPSVAHEPVVARAQVRLAAADHAGRLGTRPSGIWLPFLGYRPGLESIMGEAALRFFGAGSEEFLGGTLLPPARIFAPMVTPPGVAVFGVSPVPSRPVVDKETGYHRDPRYLDPDRALEAAADHARHFLAGWIGFASSGPPAHGGMAPPVCVVHLAAHDLGPPWPPGQGGAWLDQVLEQLPALEGAVAVSLAGYLDRYPSAVMGRPGPSAGGILSARPLDSDLFDRCRAAADLLTFALEHRRNFNALDRRCVAHMARSLLRAQQVDWSLPPGHGIDAETGLQRALAHLDRFSRLAGLLQAGRPDRRLLDELDRGPAFLPGIDLNLLCA